MPQDHLLIWSEDIKSYKKLIPTLRQYSDAIIVTADDDILYPSDWLQKLYQAYLSDPETIHCHRAHRVLFNKKAQLLPYKDWAFELGTQVATYNNFCTSGAGVLFPPNCLSSDISKSELFTQLCPNADDIWFWSMLLLNNRKISVLLHHMQGLKLVDGTQEEGLYYDNLLNGGNDKQLQKVLNHYPEILEKLDRQQFYTQTIHYRIYFFAKRVFRKLRRILSFNVVTF